MNYRKAILITLLLTALLVLAGCSSPAANASTGSVGSNAGAPANTAAPDCYTENSEIGKSIAETFTQDYDQVMSWFCGGYEYEDILLALQTAKDSNTEASALLEKYSAGQSWEEIWLELGLE